MSLIDVLDGITGDASQVRLVEMGKIKIGGKESRVRQSAGGGDWRAPEKYDHFVITTMNRDSRGDLIPDAPLMDQLIAKYGDSDRKLRRIPIRLLSDNIEDVVQSAFVWYGGKSVAARSDGKKVIWFNDPDPKHFGARYEKPIEQDWGPDLLEKRSPKGNLLFKVHTNFNCVIAAQEARWGGVYRFRTTSVISLKQLYASLLHLSQLNGGILSGMPLMFVMRPMQVSPLVNGTPKPSTIHVVHVELYGPDLQQLQERAMAIGEFRVKFADRIQSTSRQYQKLLAGPGTESESEAGDISEEFSPESSADIATVPTGTNYGLLDDAPKETPVIKNDPPADFETPPQEPVEPEIETAPEEEKPAVTNDEDYLSRDWPAVTEFFWIEAQKATAGIERPAFDKWIGTRVLAIRKKGEESKISPSTRGQWLKQIRDGKVLEAKQ